MNNPPAFPIVIDMGDGVKYQNGMTLRDYFAAKAMQATVDAWIQKSIYPPTDDEVAKNAYVIADAMMKAREA